MNKTYNKKYYKNHKKEMLQSIKNHQKDKYNNDFSYNIYQRIMSKINQILPNNSLTFEDLLGCSLDFYSDYILFCLDKDLDLTDTNTNKNKFDIHHIYPLNAISSPSNNNLHSFYWFNTIPILSSKNRQIKDNIDRDIILYCKNLVQEYLDNLR